MQLGAVLDTVIGISFVFFLLALASSAVGEWIATVLKKRAKYLLRGLRDMLDGPAAGVVAATPAPGSATPAGGAAVTAATGPRRLGTVALGTIDEVSLHEAAVRLLGGATQQEAGDAAAATAKRRRTSAVKRLDLSGDDKAAVRSAAGALPGQLVQLLEHPLVRAQASTVGRRVARAPSYLTSRTFVTALLDTFVPDVHGRTTVDEILADIEARNLPEPLNGSLLAVVRAAGTDVAAVRTGLEEWYDATMERVSGAYKRWAKRWLLVISAVFVVALHVDALAMASTLYTDPTVRAAVVAVEQASDCGGDATAACAQAARSDLTQAGLPFGPPPGCTASSPVRCLFGRADGGAVTFGGAIVTVIGLALSVLAATFGAPFWFQLLTRAASLRNTGGRPAEAKG
jgi:hypothetical protein